MCVHCLTSSARISTTTPASTVYALRLINPPDILRSAAAALLLRLLLLAAAVAAAAAAAAAATPHSLTAHPTSLAIRTIMNHELYTRVR
jgi:hypothetical protein